MRDGPARSGLCPQGATVRRREQRLSRSGAIAVSNRLLTVAIMTTLPVDDRQLTLTQMVQVLQDPCDPLVRLQAIRRIRKALQPLEEEAVRDARDCNESWSQIGASLGISKQAANRKHGSAVMAPELHPKGEPESANEQGGGRPRKARVAGWDVTTARGRTLLRFVPRRD